MSHASIGQWDVGLHKQEKTGEGTALLKAGLGLHGPGDGAPNEALPLGQLPPSGGDRAEHPAYSDLSWRSGIKRDESRVAVLAVAIALPNRVPAFA